MLTTKRQELILKLVEERGSITATELKDLLNASESTIRRDITSLDREGKLVKVFGGAVSMNHDYHMYELTVEQKMEVLLEEKRRIGSYAASLIEAEEFIFVDAGTTTWCMLEELEHFTDKKAKLVFVTNAVSHAKKIAAMGYCVYLIGGEVKASTEAIVGAQAVEAISSYHFTMGFFGTNGITKKEGLTTPDLSEALVKRAAMKHCRKKYVLADHTKFGEVTPVTFAEFRDVEVLTDQIPEEFAECENIKCVMDDKK